MEPEKYEKSDTRYWSSFARSDAHFPEDWVNIKIRLPIECIRVGERNQYLSTVYSIYHFIDESHHQSGLAFVTVHDYSFGEQRKLREGEKFISWLSTIRSTDLLNRLQYIHFQRGNVLAQFALLLQRVVNGLCSLFSHFHSNKHIFSFFFQSCELIFLLPPFTQFFILCTMSNNKWNISNEKKLGTRWIISSCRRRGWINHISSSTITFSGSENWFMMCPLGVR